MISKAEKYIEAAPKQNKYKDQLIYKSEIMYKSTGQILHLLPKANVYYIKMVYNYGCIWGLYLMYIIFGDFGGWNHAIKGLRSKKPYDNIV